MNETRAPPVVRFSAQIFPPCGVAAPGVRLAARPRAGHHEPSTCTVAAVVSLYNLARFMGTSVEQIDRRYGHVLPDAIDRSRAAFDAYLDIADRAAETSELGEG